MEGYQVIGIFDKLKDDLNLIPESSASKRIKVSEVISSKTNAKPEAKIENQRKFLEQSTEVKNKNKKNKANNFLNRQKALSRVKKIKLPHLKRILKFLILFLMFLFIYKACFLR